MNLVYKRVLLKISGQYLSAGEDGILCPDKTYRLAHELKEIISVGVQIGLVVGGGNIIRGYMASKMGIDRVAGDQMGMLATVINALALQDAFEKTGIITRVQTAISMRQFAEPFICRRSLRHLEKGRIIIFAGGTGNPYFTTDTAAALRTSEIKAEVLLKATNVDGVYDSDPKINPDAKKYDKLTYFDALKRNLRVMDQTAFAMCRDNNIPIIVFDINQTGNILKAVLGKSIGTYIGGS